MNTRPNTETKRKIDKNPGGCSQLDFKVCYADPN